MKTIEIKRNLLVVNSRDKKSGTTSDFTYSLGDNSLEIEAIALKSVCIPHTYSNVNSTNNILKVSTGSEIVLTQTFQGTYELNNLIYRVNIPAGLYTLDSLLNAINTSDGVVDNFSFAYNSGTNRVDCTNLNNFTNGVNLYDYVETGFSLLWQGLGFFNFVANQITIPNGSTVAASDPPPSNPVLEYSLTIPVGQYTIDTIMPVIVTQLGTVITGTLAWTYQAIPNNAKVQITGATDTWKFLESDIPHLIGYEPDSMTYSLSQQAIGLPDLYGTRNLYVASNTLMNGYNCIQKDGEKTAIVMSIPVCSAYLGMDKWSSQYLVMKQYDQAININEFDIQILDDANNVVPLHSADVVLTFEVWCRVKL